jgi:CheY-like chemotaxis protein
MSASTSSLPPRKILVVDDNEIILKAISLKLRSAGYEPFTATDAASAIAVAHKEPLDLILLDINFPPDMYGEACDGFHILDQLRQIERASDVPVIIISTSEAAQDRERALKLGTTAFFHKPIDHIDLLRVIRETTAATPPA